MPRAAAGQTNSGAAHSPLRVSTVLMLEPAFPGRICISDRNQEWILGGRIGEGTGL